MEFEWTEDIILDLIVDVKEYRCLWDPKSKEKKIKNKKIDAFQEISIKLGTTAENVGKKWSNLLQSYRGCRRKVKSCMVTGSGRNDVYKPSWFAYDALNQFMQDVYAPHKTIDTIHLESNEIETQLEEVEVSMRDDNYADDIQHESSMSTSPAQIVYHYAEQVKSLNTQKQSSRKRKVRGEDSRVNEAFDYLKQKREEIKKMQDEFSLFGDIIATKLRAMDKVTQQYVMNDINNIMFNAALNTYYSTAQQHPNNQQLSSLQQIPLLHSTYQSNKQTPAVPPHSDIPYSLQDQLSPAHSNSMYKPYQTITSATHLRHPSYQNTLPLSSHSAHSSTSENSTIVYPNSSFSSYKQQMAVPSNFANHTIEHLSQINSHSSYPPSENISDPSNSATPTIEHLSQVNSHSSYPPNENISNPSTFTTL